MKTINRKVLNNILIDIKKVDFISFLNTYVPTYIDSEELQHCIKNYNKTGHRYFLDKAKKEFNILIFQTIPDDSVLEDFAYFVQEDSIDNLSLFLSLYKEYMELSHKNEKEKAAFFKDSSNEVQFRYLKKAPFREANKYYYLSSNRVQNELFIQSYDPLEYPIPSKLNEDSENHIKEAINTECEELQKLIDEEILDEKTAFSRLYNQIKKTPPEIYMEYLENFVKENLEGLNNADIEWAEIEKLYSGECCLKLLSNSNIKQKKGEVFHLDFVSPYIDVMELLEVAKKYKISCDLTIRSCNDLPLSIIKILQNKSGIDIKKIKFKDYDSDEFQEQQLYTLQEYMDCRSIIDAIIKDIEVDAGVLGNNDPNREKKICGLVIRKHANMSAYNFEYYEKSDKDQQSEEEDKINGTMIGPLLYGTGVCSGDAWALKNVLMCLGIECRYIGAPNVNPKEFGHAWNQVKLDGIWYNIDLTWDRDRIVEELETKYFLKSDEDFLKHEEYIPKCSVNKCRETEPNAYRYLYRSRINETINVVNLMRKAIRDRQENRITLSEVNAYENRRNIAIKENIVDKDVGQK